MHFMMTPDFDPLRNHRISMRETDRENVYRMCCSAYFSFIQHSVSNVCFWKLIFRQFATHTLNEEEE